MKNKYVMINGLAFSEGSDMESLQNYASEGWILEGIVGGLFYKLRKDKPQNIIYSLDYQSESDEEYFTIFKEAGWELIVSIGNQTHIFSAEAGTKPIYSDGKSEVDKYIRVKNQTRKGTIISLIIALILIGMLVFSKNHVRSIYFITFGLFIIDFFVFVFNFMPYLAYSSKVKKIEKYGQCKNDIIESKKTWKVYGVVGVVILAFAISDLLEKKYFSAILDTIVAAYIIYTSSVCYKKYKKSLR